LSISLYSQSKRKRGSPEIGSGPTGAGGYTQQAFFRGYTAPSGGFFYEWPQKLYRFRESAPDDRDALPEAGLVKRGELCKGK
jgi:hypothetical protein